MLFFCPTYVNCASLVSLNLWLKVGLSAVAVPDYAQKRYLNTFGLKSKGQSFPKRLKDLPTSFSRRHFSPAPEIPRKKFKMNGPTQNAYLAWLVSCETQGSSYPVQTICNHAMRPRGIDPYLSVRFVISIVAVVRRSTGDKPPEPLFYLRLSA
jgi:hypothetical protein